MKPGRLATAMVTGIGAVAALLWLLGGPGTTASAEFPSAVPETRKVAADKGSATSQLADAPVIHYVAITGTDSGDCSTPAGACRTVQYAVDWAGEGDEVRVATGVYTDVNSHGGMRQILYVSKTVAVRGGYTVTDWSASNPVAYPTTLDSQGGGRVLNIAGDISVTIEGLRVTGGAADTVGGGVYVTGARVVISRSEIVDSFSSNYGGGLAMVNSSATLLSNTVSGNEAAEVPLAGLGFGGGLYLQDSNVTLSGNTVSDNSAGSAGGGVYSTGSDVVIKGNTISHNTGVAAGGGLDLSGGSAILFDNTITNNRAPFSKFADGGGLYLSGITATVNNNLISNNDAGYTGGGAVFFDSIVTFSHNTVTFNFASFSGGGLTLAGGTVALISNTISANGVPYIGSGGGVFLWVSDATLTGNLVLSNTASSSGGGLYLLGSDAALINNVITDNRARDRGSGLYIVGSSPRLLHTTIARNTGGDGSGIYVGGSYGGDDASSVILTNTILVSHDVDIHVTSGNTLTVKGVLWHRTPITISQEMTTLVRVEHQYAGDPSFALDGYHLTADSAALDRGFFTGVTTDIDGETRRDRCIPDLGADEFITGMDCDRVFLPVMLHQIP